MRNLSLLEDKRRKGTCHATSGNLQLWKYQSCAQNKKKKERKKQRFTYTNFGNLDKQLPSY